jgi:hypothetical protein
MGIANAWRRTDPPLPWSHDPLNADFPDYTKANHVGTAMTTAVSKGDRNQRF